MTIYSVKLYLKPLPPDEQPVDGALPVPEFAFVVEYVGVDLAAVLAQADIVISQWLKEGRTRNDVIGVVGCGDAYLHRSQLSDVAQMVRHHSETR